MISFVMSWVPVTVGQFQIHNDSFGWSYCPCILQTLIDAYVEYCLWCALCVSVCPCVVGVDECVQQMCLCLCVCIVWHTVGGGCYCVGGLGCVAQYTHAMLHGLHAPHCAASESDSLTCRTTCWSMRLCSQQQYLIKLPVVELEGKVILCCHSFMTLHQNVMRDVGV